MQRENPLLSIPISKGKVTASEQPAEGDKNTI